MARGLWLPLMLAVGEFAQAGQTARDARSAPPPVQASIAGTVVAADTGRPVRRATVQLILLDQKSGRSAQTDEQGAFIISNLQAGEYTLSAMKGGYVQSTYGQKQPGSGRAGTPIRLTEGQQLTRIALPLARGGAVSGTVRDENGEPAFGISVRAFRWVMQSGVRTLQAAGTVATDDRGVYRLHTLLPGEYLISTAPANSGLTVFAPDGASYVKLLNELEASLAGGAVIALKAPESLPGLLPSTGFATTYYPGTPQVAAAGSVVVNPGDEHTGIDIPLQVVPLARITGIVVGPSAPTPGTTIQLIEASQPPGVGGRTARADASGRFAFEGVPPGQYTLLTKTTAKGAPRLEASGREAVQFYASIDEKGRVQAANAIAAVAPLWASLDVGIDGRNQTDLHLMLQPGMTVTGRVAVEGAVAPSNLSRLTVGLTPIGVQKVAGEFGQAGPAPLDASGQFTIRGVTPGRYRLTVLGGMPSGLVLQSAIFGGQDILDVPLELDGSRDIGAGTVTLSSQSTEVSGVLRDSLNQAAPGFTVIVYAADERFWTPSSRRIHAVRPSTDGRYLVRNLPPGNYRLVAVPDVEPGRWFDPAYLRQLAGFATFALTAGGKHVQDFQIR